MNNFNLNTQNNVTFHTASNISAKHGFSTRMGGVSKHAHTASMNLAFGRGDDEQTVLENLRIFCGALSIRPETIVSAKQIHSSLVYEVGPSDVGLGRFEADGFVTKAKNVALCIKIADCVPVLFHDPVSQVIGACHAGWRGTAAGIAPITVEHMCRLGAKQENIQAAIGPCIHSCCYEVSEDFKEAVTGLQSPAFADQFIHPLAVTGKYKADLCGMNQFLLTKAGVPAQNINICPACTCCRPDLYFSHRASGGVRGTMAAVISL
ncbi:MAG: peptidoglycan editing factor PgeF [Clostridiales bacterium]|nr:peptidoglycan editing factor PgeF [Clostridiales bacterium]